MIGRSSKAKSALRDRVSLLASPGRRGPPRHMIYSYCIWLGWPAAAAKRLTRLFPRRSRVPRLPVQDGATVPHLPTMPTFCQTSDGSESGISLAAAPISFWQKGIEIKTQKSSLGSPHCTCYQGKMTPFPLPVSRAFPFLLVHYYREAIL